MSTQTQQKRAKEQETQDTQEVNAHVGKQVMETLGRPRNLLGVQVRQLWEDHYRVNVLTGADATSVTVVRNYLSALGTSWQPPLGSAGSIDAEPVPRTSERRTGCR